MPLNEVRPPHRCSGTRMRVQHPADLRQPGGWCLSPQQSHCHAGSTMYQGCCSQTERGTDGDVAGVLGARVHAFGGHHDGRHRTHRARPRPHRRHRGAERHPAAVCPEGKEEEPGRSWISSCEIHSFAGRRRCHTCLRTQFEASSATAILARPAVAALRPRHPAADRAAAAPHHSLVFGTLLHRRQAPPFAGRPPRRHPPRQPVITLTKIRQHSHDLRLPGLSSA